MSQFKNMIVLPVIATTLALDSCNQQAAEDEKPNILWIVLEDTAPLLGCYGTSIISTPNIDHLANEGIRFSNAYMSASVCSPSRSSLITGIMSTTLGTHNHHSSRTEESAIYLPEDVKTIPELFKQAGYFTFNNGKDDYNFSYDRPNLYDQDYSQHPLYGKSGVHIDLPELKNKTPFFGQIQLYGGKEIFFSSFKERVQTPVDRTQIQLPPYLPYHPVIIEEYANHLDAIQITDKRVGGIIKLLDENDLLGNTIVFFFSDHGMRMTRNKQFLYDGGIHVPFIIADFSGRFDLKAGSVDDQLIGGIDIGPSSLAIASIEIPENIEGRNFFSKTDPQREYVISSRDRCDFTIDRIRSVRSKEYKYIRNFMIDRPYSQATYMDFDGIEFVKVMHQLHAENKLNPDQDRFMSDLRPPEELYDLLNDPYELNNLANDPNYLEVLNEYAGILNEWIVDTDDQGQYPENEEGLKLMLGIWGKTAINPEYDILRKKYPDLEGSLLPLKNSGWKKVVK